MGRSALGLDGIDFLGSRKPRGGEALPEFQLMLPRCEALPVKLLHFFEVTVFPLKVGRSKTRHTGWWEAYQGCRE